MEDYQDYPGQYEHPGWDENQGQAGHTEQGEYQAQGDYQDQGYYQDAGGFPQEELESAYDNPRIASILMIVTYAVAGIGIGIGFYGYFSEGAYQGLHLAFPLMVGAVGILSFIRHSIFHRSDAINLGEDPDEEFFQIEVGFANLAIGVIALFIFFGSWGNQSEVAVTFIYALYLVLAGYLSAYRHYQYDELDRGTIMHLALWFIWVFLMFFFAVAGAVSANMPPF
ncbi:MAG: hypothetical protein JW738_01090 [Actinobacteria bacterium]|nr:hypothetical protein [Actinomycetota bacterium]